MTTPSGERIDYTYQNGRLAGITVNGATLITAAGYEPFGPVSVWQWGNGHKTYRDHDADGRLTTWEYRNGASIVRRDLTWDNANRITAIADPGNGTNSATYGYDVLDRLTSALANGVNRGYGYDAAGNPTQIDAAVHGYNLANRLASVNSTSSATYAINALGQRVGKTVDGVTTRYVYDEQGRLIGEYDQAGNLIQETVWLDDLPIATLRPTGSGTPTPIAVYYVHADHLGSPRAITRPADDAIVWRWDNQEPFGANAANENPSGLGTFRYDLRFPGQQYDAETGTNYNYFRDYDPVIGRYEQSDPIGLEGGINTYGYSNQNPLTQFDADGLFPFPLPILPFPGSGKFQRPPFRAQCVLLNLITLSPDKAMRLGNAFLGLGLGVLGLIGPSNATTTSQVVDSIGDVGLSSVVRKGADGLPVIAYLQRIPGTEGHNLKVAKCANAACSATTSMLVVVAETVTSLGDMQIGDGGRPALVFREGKVDRFLRCGDSACTSGNAVRTLSSPLPSAAGGWYGEKIAFGVGGRVYILGTFPQGIGPIFFGVGLMICGDAACDSSIFVQVPEAAGSSDIAIGANGLPVIASGGRTNSLNGHTLPLSVIRCSNASCDSFGPVRELLPAGPMYQSIRMVLAQDDAPIIALSGTSTARCLDSTCSTGASVNVVAPGYDPIELLLSAAGLPLIVLQEGSGGNALGIARCGNLACSESSIYTRIELPQHSGASASLGGDAKLIMTYFAEGPADLIALRCDAADCQDESAVSSPGQSGGHPQVGDLLAVVPDFDGSSIHLIDVRSKSVVSTFPAEPGPIGVAISRSGQRAYISNYGGQTVSYVDLVSRQIERSVSLTSGAPVGPRGIVVTPDDARLFVANSDQGAVAVIERASGSVIKSIPVGTLPFGLAINPQGTKVVVTNTNSGTVNVIDVPTATSLGAINVGAQPYGVAISPDGKTAYVASFGTDKLAVVNLETMSVSTTIPVGIGPFGVALSPNGAWAYVSDNVNQVSVVDLSLPTTVASITVGLHPQGLAVTPDGRWLYVANQDSGNLSVIDVATRVVTTTLSGGDGPVSLGAFVASAPFEEALAIEYLHQPFGHYFMTAAPNEIALLDQGFFSGWSRTGQQWKIFSAGGGLNDVCRFFTVAFAPKSSHFYTAYPHECSLVKNNPDWQYEQIAFNVALPVAGSCHVGVPLFRLYNSGQSGAPNHRYTISTTIRDQMVAQGFVFEGIAGCVPP